MRPYNRNAWVSATVYFTDPREKMGTNEGQEYNVVSQTEAFTGV